MQNDHHNENSGGDDRMSVNRRSFLKLAGFTLAGGVLAGCTPGKVENAIPMLIKPEELVPGHATWYASTCGGCSAACGVLVKNRDGRPIKIEGNPSHMLSKGGLCAVGQAMVLSLYDSHRLAGPHVWGKASTWEQTDAAILEHIRTIRQQGGAVRMVTGTITSPTQRAAINTFLSQFADARHIEYDALSSSAILDAHERTHAVRVLPHYRFDKAKVIVSFDADFLGTWISPVEFTAAYRAGRALEGATPTFSYHAQFEPRLSLTGGKADRRVRVAPYEMRAVIARLTTLVEERAGSASVNAPAVSAYEPVLQELAEKLWQSLQGSMVVCGTNDIACQLLVNRMNALLGAYDTTVDLDHPSNQRRGSDRAMRSLMDELLAGSVKGLFIQGVNPVYDFDSATAVRNAIYNVPLCVSIPTHMEETSELTPFVCPEPHPLEQWNDAEPVAGVISVMQPTIAPMTNTRPFVESLAIWSGAPRTSLDAMRAEWERSVFPRRTDGGDFQAFWDGAVEAGTVSIASEPRAHTAYAATPIDLGMANAPAGGLLEVVLYAKIGMLDGRHAFNPWLHELPDPLSKVVWDNYAALSPATAQRLGVGEGDEVNLSCAIDGLPVSVDLPVHVQQGTHDGIVAVAVGYGRKGTERFTSIGPDWLEAKPTVAPGSLVGKNAAPFRVYRDGTYSAHDVRVAVRATGRKHQLACTQEYHSLTMPANLVPAGAEPRPIIQEATFAAYVASNAAGSFEKPELETMWPPVAQGAHKWGLSVDLTACTGCGACVIGCQAENNIPIVGKDEVARNRELQWLRIDRYFEERENETVIAHQPMMCQQCGNAPCETVCPVLATMHSDEGLNQQVYNRCVGTRYCANNCPYKMRHFNWFDYSRGDDVQRMVLNPDVTVRERGIMEKCTFCVQRIQEAKIEAKRLGVPMKDGDVQPACQQSCPAQAIVFGDMNDPGSALSKRQLDPRSYHVLEELGVRPSVGYMTLVRNGAEAKEEGHV